jgi:hypothetical protein
MGALILSLLVLLAGLIAGRLRGGRLQGLGAARFRGVWLGAIGAALQAVLVLPGVRSLGVVRTLGPALLIASLVALLGFARANARLAGVPLAALGLLANLVVVTANGHMPVHPAAATRAAGVLTAPATVQRDAKHVTETRATRLAFLDERFAVPGLLVVASFGDVAIWAGLFLLAQGLVLLVPGSERRPDALAPANGEPRPGPRPEAHVSPGDGGG